MPISKEQIPVLPSMPKQEDKMTNESPPIVLVSKDNTELLELKGRRYMVDHSKRLPKPLPRDFIPEEIFVALTSAANPVPCPTFLRPPKKIKSMKDFQGCIRTADGVWQHPLRRNKFRYLIQHPISLTGAGRDVSFLYDIAEKEEKNPPPSPEAKPLTRDDRTIKPLPNVADTLVPEEFHIVKNRGVLGLEYYDDKYTTLLEDEENRLRVFPSMKPSGRLEVLQLMKVMDTMLEKAGTDNEDIGVTGLSQMHNVLEVLKVEQNIYNIVFHEIIRQVSVECAERGELLSKLRQRYVELLERIPRQMKNLYKEMMAQRVMDKHITDELFHFKEAIGQLTRELNTVREHDHRATFEAEKAYEELAKAIWDSEMNANLLDEYRQLYELQRARLEAQIQQLTHEKELWSNATYELALKVIEKNKLILARRMYSSEKAWLKGMRHFTLLMESQDAIDLTTLQQLTQEFRELLSQIGIEVQQTEETSRERARSIQNGLDGWLNYFNNHILGKGSYTLTKAVTLLDQILVDLKAWEKILTEELALYGGDMLLVRQEPLKTAATRQKQWVDLGFAVLGRHRDFNGKMPPELKLLEEINKKSSTLCEQYRRRIGGENGSARILISLLHSLEDWSFKLLAGKQKGGFHETDWIKFFQSVSEWVPPEELFKKIQQWILTTTSGSEKEIVQLTQETTDFHNVLSKWMVSLLIHMVPEFISHNTLPLTEAEIARQAEQKMLNLFNLEVEAKSLAAKLSKFSCYIVSCCKEMVASITRKKRAAFEPDADQELQQLEKIKTECLDWIETCNLLLSGMKTSPTTLVSQEELINLFGLEVVQQKRQLPPRPETYLESSFHVQTEQAPKEDKKDKEAGSEKEMEKPEALESEETPSMPSTSIAVQTEGVEIIHPVRYIGDDANVHTRPLNVAEITVSGRELYASQWTNEFSKREFEMLASLEILEERLLEAEKRAQQAEEKSEALHEELEEALTKIHDMEGEEQNLKEEEEPEPELEVPSKKKLDTSLRPGSTKTSTRVKKSTKPKR
ncbi:axonemal dynein light chain domain-containing protein 1 isoform X2 [Sceloporus undulatus]|uniref:axonemal dynein light chain domain-containing protein 1 isoform X2 n=1 Tax=Sceloporus undulatus TaxID=8520 RepID=UPI001C4B96CE|nr:axonemal dynein light chain domain-containing protein 1 isoform X2 [Sceloporus undulatus]